MFFELSFGQYRSDIFLTENFYEDKQEKTYIVDSENNSAGGNACFDKHTALPKSDT